MDSLAHIIEKYKIVIDPAQTLPIEIPNVGRNNLADLFCELGYQSGVEIGTAGGRFAEVLCQANPSLRLHCVDAYAVYKGYRDYVQEAEVKTMQMEAHERLNKYRVDFVRAFSMNAVDLFADNSLDFVYIDANHEWPFVTQDIYYWSKKVRLGGIVSGHDYYRSNRKDSKCHVKGAVTGYTFAFRIAPWFLLGRNERVPGEIRERSRSWFWVKA